MEEFGFESDLDGFSEYGSEGQDLDVEIQEDLKSFLYNSLRSLPFDRGRGLGVEGLENETIGTVRMMLIKTFIVKQIYESYNSRVPDFKQVITTTDFVEVDSKEGYTYIKVSYFNKKDVGTTDLEIRDATIGV